MQRDHAAGPVGQDKQIAARQPPQTAGGILNGGLMLRGHQRPQVGQVRQQLGGVRQGKFTFPLEILEGTDRIAQVGEDFPPDLLLHAVPHQQKAGTGESGGDQQHGEQKLGAHPKFQHQRSLLPPVVPLSITVQICSPCRAPFGSVPDWPGPSPASAAASECDCPRCGWRDNSDSPRLHSAVRRARSRAPHSAS